MLGDKIKEYIAKSNHIIIKYLGVVSVSEAYAKQRQLFEELDQLIEKANRVDELENENINLMKIANQNPINKDTGRTYLEENNKYIELGKAIEWATKKEVFHDICIINYEYTIYGKKLLEWYRSEGKDEQSRVNN